MFRNVKNVRKKEQCTIVVCSKFEFNGLCCNSDSRCRPNCVSSQPDFNCLVRESMSGICRLSSDDCKQTCKPCKSKKDCQFSDGISLLSRDGIPTECQSNNCHAGLLCRKSAHECLPQCLLPMIQSVLLENGLMASFERLHVSVKKSKGNTTVLKAANLDTVPIKQRKIFPVAEDLFDMYDL